MSISNSFIRKWHRDFGYFFAGLIISFAVSGIAQNHRSSWNPKQYIYSSIVVKTPFNKYKKEQLIEDTIKHFLILQNVSNKLFGIHLDNKDSTLEGFFEGGVIKINLKNGQGVIEMMKNRPILGQMSVLHTNNNKVWIWYSDIFGIGLFLIAFSGLFMMKGKNSFRKRGYILSIIGIIIPLMFLIFIF